MAQYIDKTALVAEIKKRINFNERLNAYPRLDECNEILSFLDTLEVKEVDLEKETKKWWKEHLHLNPENKLWMDAHQSIVFAKHFFELGIAVSNKAQKEE